ncbi:MAG: ComEA family DNA-binding protein [Chloroflexi bacterium]|nr:ComEA family DNA-binding protein [Chloroflexota bacterium]
MSTSTTSWSYVIVFLVLIILIAISGAVLLRSRPKPVLIEIHPPAPTSTPLPTPTPAPITVYVTGAVTGPDQLYELPHGSRVSDAVAAAGGLLEGANRTLVNLAAVLRDGDQVHVPFADAAAEAIDLPTPPGGERVYINSATQAELETLPGVGPALAQRIIDYRELVGTFDTLDDLDKVSGIGPATLEGLKDLLAFD